MNNGIALCSLHHKLFDHGALGIDETLRVVVSAGFTSRTAAGRAVYGLHGRELAPRPGTEPVAEVHAAWHRREVFKAPALAS